MDNPLEAIKKRRSVRTFHPGPLGPAELDRLQELCRERRTGPFGNPVRFRLLDLSLVSEEERRRLGTYGVIRGARFYILAAVKDQERAMEDLGYCMEKLILELVSMGLGTCWMAGTFRRSSFAAQMDLEEGELLPAISPVGYPADWASLTERVMRYGVRADRRKPFEELFLEADGSPLTREAAGLYRDALEAVRLGPSASNRQPWRMLRDEGGCFHLFLKEDQGYNRAQGRIRIQNIDMGIAMCHFELAAGQLGLKGRWLHQAPGLALPGLEYIATWA